MKKVIISIIVILLGIDKVVALSPDSISTVYEDGNFFSRHQVRVNASSNISTDVADYLLSDFRIQPNNLFNWALKGLGLEDKKNEVIIICKSSKNDYKTNITHGVFDVVVPDIITFRNVRLDGIASKTKYVDGQIRVVINIIYSSLLLKNAVGTLTFIPQPNHEQLIISTLKVRFGWFFNIFITQKRYKRIVEWRVKKFSENIKSECIKRQNSENNKVAVIEASEE